MKGISQVLQLSVIVERAGPSAPKSKGFEKFDFFFCGVAAHGGVLNEFLEPALLLYGPTRFDFNVMEPHQLRRRQPPVQDNFHLESFQIDIPQINKWVKKRNAMIGRDVENVRIQKLESACPHFFV